MTETNHVPPLCSRCGRERQYCICENSHAALKLLMEQMDHGIWELHSDPAIIVKEAARQMKLMREMLRLSNKSEATDRELKRKLVFTNCCYLMYDALPEGAMEGDHYYPDPVSDELTKFAINNDFLALPIGGTLAEGHVHAFFQPEHALKIIEWLRENHPEVKIMKLVDPDHQGVTRYDDHQKRNP